MSYANWKASLKSAGSMFLDPRNPRIPPSPRAMDEPELIAELVRHDDVHQLAANIKSNGFFPTEPLVTIHENGKLYVVEGNRRLAACKLLINPDSAPDEFKPRFRTLAAGVDPAAFREIPTLLAPDRASTIPIIIARHTATQIQKWEPIMQAGFYKQLMANGSSIEEVAQQFHIPPGEMREALRSHNLYQMACRLDLTAEVMAKVRDPREFSLTNLSRICETRKGRSFFGIEFPADGRVVGTTTEEEFKKGFRRLVEDVANESVDSRTLNSPGDIERYLKRFSAAQRPDHSSSGTFDSESFMNAAVTAPAPMHRPKAPRARAVTRATGLVPRSFRCNLTSTRVQDILTELRSLQPGKYRTSTALSFRCFVELCVYLFLKSKGEITKMHSEKSKDIRDKNVIRAKKGLALINQVPTDWSPNLSEMMGRILDAQPPLISDPQIVKALRRAVQNEKNLLDLNLCAHSWAYHPSETKLRESLNKFSGIHR